MSQRPRLTSRPSSAATCLGNLDAGVRRRLRAQLCTILQSLFKCLGICALLSSSAIPRESSVSVKLRMNMKPANMHLLRVCRSNFIFWKPFHNKIPFGNSGTAQEAVCYCLGEINTLRALNARHSYGLVGRKLSAVPFFCEVQKQLALLCFKGRVFSQNQLGERHRRLEIGC